MNPKISIIVPSFNQCKYIERTLDSIMGQDWPDTETLVIDGGSKDRTIEILEGYGEKIRWLSESDNGQSDALNKGLRMATGEIVGWLNSDDYYEDNIFAQVAEVFKDPRVEWAIGNLASVYDKVGKRIVAPSPRITLETLLSNPDIVRQQSTFFRRQFLIASGGFDESLYMVMDVDLWVRLSKQSEPRMVDSLWANFRLHGDQKSSAGNLLRQRAELNRLLKRENVPWIRRNVILSNKYVSWVKAIAKRALISLRIIDPTYLTVPYSMRKV